MGSVQSTGINMGSVCGIFYVKLVTIRFHIAFLRNGLHSCSHRRGFGQIFQPYDTWWQVEEIEDKFATELRLSVNYIANMATERYERPFEKCGTLQKGGRTVLCFDEET